MDKISLKNKKIMVTGGNGYLGKFLVEALIREKANVVVIDKDGETNKNFFNIDITNEKAVKNAIEEIKPEIIFHLASSLDRRRDFENYKKVDEINHIGTFNLLFALKYIPYENFIFTSTSEVYGENRTPFKEDHLPKPVSQYSLTKLYSEHLIQTFSKNFDKNYTILRLFNFYGKDMPPNFFISQMIAAFERDKYFDMTKGEQKRDFLYVEDVVQALLLSAKSPDAYNEIFNVCSGKASNLKHLAEEIKKNMRSECEIRFGAIPYRKNEIWDMYGDNSKIKRKLNFEVKYDLTGGIEKMIN